MPALALNSFRKCLLTGRISNATHTLWKKSTVTHIQLPFLGYVTNNKFVGFCSILIECCRRCGKRRGNWDGKANEIQIQIWFMSRSLQANRIVYVGRTTNCRCCTNTNQKNRIRTYARLSSHPVPVLQAHDYGKAIKIHQGSGMLIFMQYLMTYSQRKLVYMKLKWVLIENITWVRLTHPFTMIMQR